MLRQVCSWLPRRLGGRRVLTPEATRRPARGRLARRVPSPAKMQGCPVRAPDSPTIYIVLVDLCGGRAASPRPHRHPDLRRRTLRSPHLLVGQPPFLPTAMLYNMEPASGRRCPRLEPLSEPRTSPVAANGQHDGGERGEGRGERGRGNSPGLESELGALECVRPSLYMSRTRVASRRRPVTALLIVSQRAPEPQPTRPRRAHGRQTRRDSVTVTERHRNGAHFVEGAGPGTRPWPTCPPSSECRALQTVRRAG